MIGVEFRFDVEILSTIMRCPRCWSRPSIQSAVELRPGVRYLVLRCASCCFIFDAQVRSESDVSATIFRPPRQLFMESENVAETSSEDIELREMIMRYRKMEQETSDPMAMRLLHDIVSELETELHEREKK